MRGIIARKSFEAVAADRGGVEAGAKDEVVVVTQGEAGRSAMEPAEAVEQGSFQGPLGGLGASGVVELPITIDNGTVVQGNAASPSNMQEYNFESLALNSSANVEIVGKVVINMKNGTNVNGGCSVTVSLRPPR